jgi:hypothetical protein
VRQTEGPYFKPSSPERADLVEPNSKARLVELRGRSSIYGTPMSAANTTLAGSAIVDIYSRMLRDAIASGPFCRRSTLA